MAVKESSVGIIEFPSLMEEVTERFQRQTVLFPLLIRPTLATYFKRNTTAKVITNTNLMSTFLITRALIEDNVYPLTEPWEKKLSYAATHVHDLPQMVFRGMNPAYSALVAYMTRSAARTRSVSAKAALAWLVQALVAYTYESKASLLHPAQATNIYVSHLKRLYHGNGEVNEANHENIYTFPIEVEADLLVMHAPPMAGYQSDEELATLEGIISGTLDISAEFKPERTLGSAFESDDKYLSHVIRILRAAEHIPTWLVALPDVRLGEKMVRQLRQFNRYIKVFDEHSTDHPVQAKHVSLFLVSR
jgi:hypothetical protein